MSVNSHTDKQVNNKYLILFLECITLSVFILKLCIIFIDDFINY